MKEVILFQRNYSECPDECATEDEILQDIMQGIKSTYEPCILMDTVEE